MAEELTQPNVPEFTVSEVSAALKRTVEDAFGYVRIRGEISRPTVASSGHCYLRLKDENAVIDAVIWRGSMAKLAHKPEEGMDVVASGRLTTYPGRSTYQIIIDAIELAGEGALLKLLEDRRKKLLAEGLFDEDRKKPLPVLPEIIGVVTSPTGAVIRDILHRLEDRFPRRVLLWPVRVQGEGAAEEITAAIEGFNALTYDGAIPRPDVLIVARGGGSLEDLWAFNEENVVRAAAASDIPLISAVGHETDTTLIDFAADQRAPTPTAAAEMAVPVRLELVSQVQERVVRLGQSLARLFKECELHVQGLERGLPNLKQLVEQKQQDLDIRVTNLRQGPKRFLKAKTQSLSIALAGLRPALLKRDVEERSKSLKDCTDRFFGSRVKFSNRAKDQLAGLFARLESVSTKQVLERGYALVTAEDGTPVTAAAGAVPGSGWAVNFHDGQVDVTVGRGAMPKTKSKKKSGKKGAKTSANNRQGSLL